MITEIPEVGTYSLKNNGCYVFTGSKTKPFLLKFYRTLNFRSCLFFLPFASPFAGSLGAIIFLCHPFIEIPIYLNLVTRSVRLGTVIFEVLSFACTEVQL